MLAIGASLFGILFARLLFTVIIIFVLIRVINRISKNKFDKYFVK